MRPPSALEALRAQVRQIEGRNRRTASVLPFGIPALDARLAHGGLARGALHEVAGAGHDAAATLFAAGIAARAGGKVLWCLTQPDLFAPALSQAGLTSDRVIYLEGGDDRTVLACCEEGLRHGGLGAVVAEIVRLGMTASRRLQLAAEASATIGIALRRRYGAASSDAVCPADAAPPSAAVTRWRIAALPAAPLPVPGVGRPRWRVELIRSRSGEGATFELEACDDTGHLRLPADLVHGPGQAEGGRHSAFA